MKIVIPLAGFGTRFPESEWKLPKPLIEVNGKTLLEYSVRSIPILEQDSILFIIRNDTNSEPLQREIHRICNGKNFSIHILNRPTRGQAETVYEGTLELNPLEDILIHNGDSALNLTEFPRNLLADGILVTFKSNESRWSYASCGDDGFVSRVEEKMVISDKASTGTYYFSSIHLFQKCYLNFLNDYDNTSEIYVAPLYNQMLKLNYKVILQESANFFCLGTPQDLKANSARLQESWRPRW
jgi:NDP-sugar pyrophosphorylase family protein